VDDNTAQGGHLVPIAFHQTQDPISETPALGRTSIGMGVFTHTLRGSQGFDASEDGTGRGVPMTTGTAGVRRLTPVECERLQGMPDNWTAPPGLAAPDSRRYAAVGDAVTVPVARWIGERLLRFG
jgi:DNA (cytosine-5)-methyltransferase 1